MDVSYFDSREPFDESGVANVDRVYRLAWHRFEERDWHALGEIYRRLPGWCPGMETQRLPGLRGWLGGTHEVAAPCWFGNDESLTPHLTASVEPPGLQIAGVLPRDDFERWHEQFLAAIAGLPSHEPG